MVALGRGGVYYERGTPVTREKSRSDVSAQSSDILHERAPKLRVHQGQDVHTKRIQGYLAHKETPPPLGPQYM